MTSVALREEPPVSVTELDYAIPLIDDDIYLGDSTVIPIDTSDPRHHEPLVPLESVGVAYQCHHARTDGANWPYHRPVEGARKDVWLRKTVAEMLARVNRRLRPFGAELFVLDGYRPIACQRGLWEFFLADAARQAPDASPESWRDLALKHVDDPGAFDETNSSGACAHSSGAAIDLTLRDLRSGEVVDMGARYDDVDEIGHNDHFERELAAGRIADDDRRLRYRRLIHWAMCEEGFANDPYVFWHYEWGNQLYIDIRQSLFGDAPAAAWYGYIAPPPELVRAAGF